MLLGNIRLRNRWHQNSSGQAGMAKFIDHDARSSSSMNDHGGILRGFVVAVITIE